MAVLIDAHPLEEGASLASTDEMVASLDFSGHDDHDLKILHQFVRAQFGFLS